MFDKSTPQCVTGKQELLLRLIEYVVSLFWIREKLAIKGRTISKLMVGAGEVQKKYSRKGKLNEKKFMHAN